MTVGPEAAHHRQTRVEEFLWSADNHAARVRVASNIEIEVADFAPIALGTLFEFAAIGPARGEIERKVTKPNAMGLFEAARGLHRQVGEGAIVIVIRLEDY